MEDEHSLQTALTGVDSPHEEGHGPSSNHVIAAAGQPEVAGGHEDDASKLGSQGVGPRPHDHQHANASNTTEHNPVGHASTAGASSHLPFVAPSDLLRVSQFRPVSNNSSASASIRSRPGTASSADTARVKPMHPQDREQIEGLRAIRAFLKVRTSYDVLPLSYRLIVFDTSLLVKKSLNILTQCGTKDHSEYC